MTEPEEIQVDSGLTALKMSAIQTHEIYLELQGAGFEHRDAIQIVGIMLSSGILFNPSRTFGYDYQEFEEEDLDPEDGDDFV